MYRVFQNTVGQLPLPQSDVLINIQIYNFNKKLKLGAILFYFQMGMIVNSCAVQLFHVTLLDQESEMNNRA